MRIAIVQMRSTSSLNENLSRMEVWIREAKNEGAELIVFPEMAYLTGRSGIWQPEVARFSELMKRFSGWAAQYGIALAPGTLREPATDSNRYFNSLPFFSEQGNLLANYRKLFLFQANLPHKKYFEGKYCEAGSEVVSVEWNGWTVGLSVCFDLRFGELFRALAKKNVNLILLPAAFTVPTGQAHWEILIRARAIETQSFVVAPGLTGLNGEELENYGHSLVVDPWGRKLTEFGTEEGFRIVELHRTALTEAREKIDMAGCRRAEIL